jgi:hypothetical protein
MKLLADEGVDKPIVGALRQAGFDVIYILESNPGCRRRIYIKLIK